MGQFEGRAAQVSKVFKYCGGILLVELGASGFAITGERAFGVVKGVVFTYFKAGLREYLAALEFIGGELAHRAQRSA